ncbi:MAG TPA: UDP-N-acetylglucosamine 2-epimerase (non-hydrolyzing) [Gemmatimonadaceae bacterium]|nr:UDP-N-acetylglucosamine 2-epimerase (non-hydrolyzing) [Gemmatimonadaceae bacterium]
MNVLVVAGARPNFMKVAPILRALAGGGSPESHEARLVHTGQHYDAAMSDTFWRDLGLPEPAFALGVGSGTHADQTARIMQAFEPVLMEVRPDWVVVVGDVNSTLACALVTAKLAPQLGARVAHVEAGLRSGDWRMPEEVNRVLTDRLSDLLLLPSDDAEPNLLREGLDPARMRLVGNVMIDSLYAVLPAARALGVPAATVPGAERYAVATLHRPSNVDDKAMLALTLDALGRIANAMPVVLPLHPRTRQRVEQFGLQSSLDPLIVREPLGYLEMLALLDGSAVVVTDSGGVQEETCVLGVPCVTLREQTERPVTVTQGTNRLVPWPPTVDGILAAAEAALAVGRFAVGERAPEGWDGRAAERIVAALVEGLDAPPLASAH